MKHFHISSGTHPPPFFNKPLHLLQSPYFDVMDLNWFNTFVRPVWENGFPGFKTPKYELRLFSLGGANKGFSWTMPVGNHSPLNGN